MDNKFNVTLGAMTRAQTGVVLYHGAKGSEHVAVELREGRVRVSFDIGNGERLTLLSATRVNDGQMRRIEVVIQGRTLSLRIDDNKVLGFESF